MFFYVDVSFWAAALAALKAPCEPAATLPRLLLALADAFRGCCLRLLMPEELFGCRLRSLVHGEPFTRRPRTAVCGRARSGAHGLVQSFYLRISIRRWVKERHAVMLELCGVLD